MSLLLLFGGAAPSGPSGSATTALARHTGAGSGSTTAPAVTGTSATTLARVAGAGAGSTGNTGTSATTLTRHTAAGTGSTGNTGTSATTLTRHTAAGAGSTGTSGTSATTLTRHTGAGTGSTAAPAVTGTSATTLTRHTGAGTGSTGTSGSSATTLQRHTAAGSGTSTAPGAASGSGSPSLQRVTGAGSGTTTVPAVTGTSATTLTRHAGAGSGAAFSSTVVPPVLVASATSSGSSSAMICSYPAHSRGDLIFQWCFNGDDLPFTPPANVTSASSPAITIAVDYENSGADLGGSAWSWVAQSDGGSGSVAVAQLASRAYVAGCLVFQTGTFDPERFTSITTPALGIGNTAVRSAWSAAGPDHMLVVGVGIDSDPLVAASPTGWTNEALLDGANVAIALYTRDTLTVSSPESIASTSFGSFSSDRYIAVGLAVIPQTIPDAPTTLSLPISIPTPTFTSSVDIRPDVIEAGISFLASEALGNYLLVSPATLTLATEIDAPLVGGDLVIFATVLLLRVEMNRPSQYRLTGQGGRARGGYEPKATPAERRGQLDLRRKVQDLENP